jgi:3-methyladenine DNA glycosylase AlkD
VEKIQVLKMATNVKASTEEILRTFETLRNLHNIEGMARFGIKITPEIGFGISVTTLRKMAKPYGKNQPLADILWRTGFHEARMFATLLADKEKFTKRTMDAWVRDFYSWDICDGACFNIFRYLPWAYEKVWEYAASDEEFVRRTAFSLIAGLAVGDKKTADKAFEPFLPLIEKHATDERNFVRKAVNWALRGIGKRSKALHPKAVKLAEKLSGASHKTARWIGKDAYKELTNPKTIARIKG